MEILKNYVKINTFFNKEQNRNSGIKIDDVVCKCGRWLHEDCVEDVEKDNVGVENYCSFCFS